MNRSSSTAASSDDCDHWRRAFAQRPKLLSHGTRAGTLGAPLGPYGERSPFETAVRWHRDSKTPETGSCFTPLQASVGTITPSSLHYERHHSGIPTIDPAKHRLVIHGMVGRPLSLTMAEIQRLPSITRTLVLECGGNSAGEWAARTGADVQRSYGLVSCSEWTGVPLARLLAEVGVKAGRRGDREGAVRAGWSAAPRCPADGLHLSLPTGERRNHCRRRAVTATHQPWLGRQYERQVASQPEAHQPAVHGEG